MSEFRRDGTSGAWVIIAPERGKRPQRSHRRAAGGGPRPPFDPTCPFCPGNEHLLAGIVEDMGDEDAAGWLTRVVPNKFPALAPAGGPAEAPGEDGTIAGYGYHEVIIETPRHDADLAGLSGPELAAVARTWRRRYATLMGCPGIASAVIFRNHGRGGGASIAHPHSQAIASPVIPPRLAALIEHGRAHYGAHEGCATCALLDAELADGRRVIEKSERFLAFVPFAASAPFEQWIVPRRHGASFAGCDGAALAELGALVGRVLGRLKAALDDPPYNFAIDSPPAGEGEAPYVHWRLRIVPGLVTPGGFELGSGLPINPSCPEEDARVLRAAAKEGAT